MTTSNAKLTEERHWYALYTRPRFEKKIESELRQKELITLLPLRTVVRVWSDRKKKIEEPWFPSYVFVYANPKERYLSVQTRGVVRVVGFNGQPSRIPEEQIQGVMRIMEFGYDPEPFQYLNCGDAVEVVSGPLTGLKGYVVEKRGGSRLVISIDAIRQSIAVTVEQGQLRKLRQAAPNKRPAFAGFSLV